MTRAAKVSLREFYEHHGKPIEATLPKKSGDGVRNGDQGCSSRLAQLSIDPRSYPYAPLNDAGRGQHGSRVDVDYDYYGARKQPSYISPRSGYASGRPGSAAGTGYVGPASAAGGSDGQSQGGAAAVHRSGAAYGTGARLPRGEAHVGSSAPPAGEDVWYPPPPPPPPRRASPTSLLHSSPPDAFSAPPPAAAHYASPRATTFAPPPPPTLARDQVVTGQQVQVPTAVPAALISKKVAASAQHAETPKSLEQGEALVSMVAHQEKAEEDSSGKSSGSAAGTTPFATAAPPAPAAPRNEFAEKLAARAIANAPRMKSSLVADGTLAGSGSLSSSCSAATDMISTEEVNGAFVAPAHPFGRPRLNLKPRSASLADSNPANTSSSSASSESGLESGEKDSTASVASSAAGRPRLQLQPRTLPLPQDAALSGSAMDGTSRPRLNLLPRGSSLPERRGSDVSEEAKRKPSVFGNAKPREEVLKDRGVDPVDSELPRGGGTANGVSRLSEAAVARLGGGKHGGNGSHSSFSGADDDWQVAGRRGSYKASHEAGGGSGSHLLGDDPFFGNSYGRAAPSSRVFDKERDARIHNNRSDAYGSPAVGGWGGRGYGYDNNDDVEDGVFARALPTRQLPLAL